MKVIPLSEAKAKLSRYGRLCHDEPVVVTVNGKPFFQLVPLEEEDDLVDRLLEHHAGFRALLKRRLREPIISADEAARQLGSPPSPRSSRVPKKTGGIGR